MTKETNQVEPIKNQDINDFLHTTGNTFGINEFQQTPKAKNVILTESMRVEISAFLRWAMIYTDGKAIGLAANQCMKGLEVNNNNYFVILGKINQIYINPEILEYSGQKTTTIEGCLSWPNKKIKATRYNNIKIRFMTIDGEVKEESIEGYYAQVFQHEYNHLQGIPEEVIDTNSFVNENKISRNDPCPCGSGKKYKKCCER